MAFKTNRQILTKGKSYANKQSRKFGTDEVGFDKDSRLDFLTGFHKRKLQRQKNAQEFNKEQERLARIEERKKVRAERKKQMDEQMRRFKETLDIQEEIANAREGKGDDIKKVIEDENESWEGFSDDDDVADSVDQEEAVGDEVKPILKSKVAKAVYDDETTVQIETLEPNENFEYLAKLNNVKLEQSEKVLTQSITRATKYAKFLGLDEEKEMKKKKKSNKKFRYLTKNERRDNQRKAYNNKHRKRD